MACNHDEDGISQTIDLTIPAKVSARRGHGVRLCVFRLAGSEDTYHIHISGDGIELVETVQTFGVTEVTEL